MPALGSTIWDNYIYFFQGIASLLMVPDSLFPFSRGGGGGGVKNYSRNYTLLVYIMHSVLGWKLDGDIVWSHAHCHHTQESSIIIAGVVAFWGNYSVFVWSLVSVWILQHYILYGLWTPYPHLSQWGVSLYSNYSTKVSKRSKEQHLIQRSLRLMCKYISSPQRHTIWRL